jgi:nitrogen fixation NifU-like protein
MADGEESTLRGQPVTFFDEMPLDKLGMLAQGQAELAQEVARRAARRFSTRVLRAALFPQHLGTMDQPDGYAHAQGYCGDLMTFYLRIESDLVEERILKVTFTTDGCDATTASGEMLASMVAGMSLKEAEQVTPDDLLTALDGLPPNHVHCAELAVQTLREAIESYRGDGNP